MATTPDPHAFDNMLAAILERTYQQHALGDRPWGVKPNVPIAGGCSYAAGCAVGISLQPATAQRLDQYDPEALTIAEVLDKDPQVRLELFGTDAQLPDRPGRFLKQLQHHHDHCATMRGATDPDKRAAYRGRLEQLAEEWGLPLESRHAQKRGVQAD